MSLPISGFFVKSAGLLTSRPSSPILRSMTNRWTRAALSVLLSFGIALFVDIYRQSLQWTILDHSFQFGLSFFCFWAVTAGILILSWLFFARRDAKRPGADPAGVRRRGILAALPLGLFILSPWLLRFYTTGADLRLRLRLLAAFIILAVLAIKAADLAEYHKKSLSFLARAESKFSSLPLRRRLIILFVVSFLIYQLSAFILVAQGTSFSGDEPYYLMTTHSLFRDGDINLANNYAQQDYFEFYSRKDNPRLKLGIYGRYGRKGKDYIYPINLPGISFVMLPFYWLSGFFSGRWLTFILKGSLAVWGSLLGLQIYLYLKDTWNKERLSLGLWAIYAFSSPILFFAVHLYPEVPIALVSFYVFRKVTGKSSLSTRQIAFLGLALGLFPWFGLKYNFLFWPLLAVSVYFLLKEHRVGRRAIVFVALPLVSQALFYVFIHSLYGTFSPIAVYEGVMTPERAEAFKQTFLGIPLRARIEAFLDYFLDQRDGLLLYSPAYFFVFLGLVEIWRRRKRDFWCLLFLGLPFLLNYALFTHRQGASPQGRVLTPLSWIGAIAMGHFLVSNRRRIFKLLFGAASAAGLIVAGLLLAHPPFLYQPTTHEFTSRPGELFIHLSNLHFFLPPYLPSFIKVDNARYWPNYLWVLGLIGFALVYAMSRKEKPLHRAIPGVLIFAALASAFFLWVLFPRSVLYPARTIQYSPQRSLGFSTFSAGKGVIAKDNGDFYLHVEKDYTFLFASTAKLDSMKLVFGSDAGKYDLKLSLFDLPLFEETTAYETREKIFAPPASYSIRNLQLYELNLRLTHLSGESMLADPFLIQIIPWRE
jgi:hypothetical protein